jgi:septal ring factor EnvC (AmiA/AmiB activator)
MTAVIPIIAAIAGILAFAGSLWAGYWNLKRIRSQAEHLQAKDVQIYTSTASELIEPLRKEMNEARAEATLAKDEAKKAKEEAESLRAQIREMSRDLQAQQLMVAEATENLNAANARATFWENEFHRVNRPPGGHQ